jgi:hypothetical protein
VNLIKDISMEAGTIAAFIMLDDFFEIRVYLLESKDLLLYGL